MAKSKFKTGPLTKKEKSYIIDNKDVPPEQIAKKLKRRVESVLNTINNKPKDQTPPVVDKKSFPINDLLAKRTDRGVVVMTEAASMLSDEKRLERKSKDSSTFIHKFRND